MNIMKKLIFVIVIGIGLTTTPSLFADDETATVSEAGVSFSYPKGWTKNIKDVAARTDIWVSNGKGTIFMVQVYKIPVTPAKLSKGYDTSFKKRFAGKLIPAREKKSERTFLGKKREGKTIAVEKTKTVYSTIDLYTLQLTKQKKTCIALFQNSIQDINAEKAFAAIAKSLKEVVVE